jgi:hypothetical protein
MLHSYQTWSPLNWSQKKKRQRGLLAIATSTVTALGLQHLPAGAMALALSTVAAVVLVETMLSHLRQSDSAWTKPRLITIIRVGALALTALLTAISLVHVEIWGAISVVCGFWNARLLRGESLEITNEFKSLRQRLATLEAQQMGVQTMIKDQPREHRDNSLKAS